MNLYGRFDEMLEAVLTPLDGKKLHCADFFCGIGGFHIAATNLGLEVVFACDIDEKVRKAYEANFGLAPLGDIVSLVENEVPPHDLLFAGFPCQPFSIIGKRQGLSDPRGSLFFELLRFIDSHQPSGIVLENVKQLATMDKGRVLQCIKDELRNLGYTVDHRVLNALDFGLPQKRERTIIVATIEPFDSFPWPTVKIPMTPLSEILEQNPDPKFRASQYIRERRKKAHTASVSPAIWHENKGGNVSSHPYSCALRAGASHNYLLVDGERRLTPREQLRLQGFPDSWKIVCTDGQTRKQTGNSVPVPLVQSAIEGVLNVIEQPTYTRRQRAL